MMKTLEKEASVMNAFKTKLLPASVSMLMTLGILGSSSTSYATDIEIYQAAAANKTQVTLMLLIDISGSMGIGNSMRDDYNIKAGNGPQYGNNNDRMPAPPEFEELNQLNPGFKVVGSNGVVSYNFDVIKNYGTKEKEYKDLIYQYRYVSPNSYCKLGAGLDNWQARMSFDGALAVYKGNNMWQASYVPHTNPLTPTSKPDDYPREYCEIPLNGPPKPENYINQKTGNSWAIDPVRGCPEEDTNGDGVADVRRCYSRLTRVKDALFDVVKGNKSKGIEALSDDKVVGLSTIGVRRSPIAQDAEIRINGVSTHALGTIRVPARRLDAIVGGKTHRQILLEAIGSLDVGASTPTSQSLAETASYMFGTTTSGSTVSGFIYSSASTKNGGNYKAPESLTNQKHKQCHGQGIYLLTDGEPNSTTQEQSEGIMTTALGGSYGAGFTCKVFEGNSVSWNCMNTFTERLIDPTQNPLGVKVKTALVGFGRNYFDVPKYDKAKTKAENLDLIKTNNEASRAARLGIRGEGGWYPGSSSEDVVNSINDFIETLNVDIPTTTTGTPMVAIDALAPLGFSDKAYYATFAPKPGASKRVWLGDMNLYYIRNRQLVGQDETTPLFKDDNSLNTAAKGLWGDGVKSNLSLKATGDVVNRTVYTNVEDKTNTELTKVDLDSLYGLTGALKSVSAGEHNTWLNILGYDIAQNTVDKMAKDDLAAQPELRQLGATMHSTPVLLTQEGKVTRTTGYKFTTATDRKDYTLFGSTQGILHIIDTNTGKEKFAFVPKEMMQNQSQGFQNEANSSGALAYGIDGAWTAYTQYISKDDKLTVNDSSLTGGQISGKGLQWVYGGLRMGGRSYYALDLSNIDKPKIKFHINPDAAAANTPLSFMGQSWSKPVIGFVNWEGKRKLVMFVGGGYDMVGGADKSGYENKTYQQTNGVGAGVYMFDAHDGSLLWWGSANASGATSGSTKYTHHDGLKYSVVSRINAIDRNDDGLVDHLYFGDLGGQLFRVDMDNTVNSTSSTDGIVKRIVRLHNGNVAGGLSPRFYEMPSVSLHENPNNGYARFALVAATSGNRSSPLAGVNPHNGISVTGESAQDGLFVVFDHDITRKELYSLKDTELRTPNATSDDLATFDGINEIMVKDTTGYKRGWKYYFEGNAGMFKGMDEPFALDNFLFATAYTPFKTFGKNTDSCNAGVLGESYIYRFCLPGGKCNIKNAQLATTNVVKSYAGDGNVSSGFGSANAGGKSDADNTLTGLLKRRSDPTATDTTFDNTLRSKSLRWYESR